MSYHFEPLNLTLKQNFQLMYFCPISFYSQGFTIFIWLLALDHIKFRKREASSKSFAERRKERVSVLFPLSFEYVHYFFPRVAAQNFCILRKFFFCGI